MKIGIITHYHKSKNYGGNLQAYALCRLLTKNGYEAEQICYEMIMPSVKKKSIGKRIKRVLTCKNSLFFVKIFDRITAKVKKHAISCEKQKRDAAFLHFNRKLIPHTEKDYTEENIRDCVDLFDTFITGSDQVWNPLYYSSPFFLNFVPSEKRKLAYAASIGCESLTDAQKAIFQNSLTDYKAISVREGDAVALLREFTPLPIQVALDPTLVLEREDWDAVASERLIEGDYLFCYFLGYNRKERKLAKKYAKKNGLKIVSIPMILYGYSVIDWNFGDVKLNYASPQDFISLIKYAKCVFTDSFHAVVFSNIYQKQYFVFNRSKQGEMSTRIVDITALFGQEERFCRDKTREKLAYITALSDIDYKKENEAFENAKRESIEFLKKNLEG